MSALITGSLAYDTIMGERGRALRGAGGTPLSA